TAAMGFSWGSTGTLRSLGLGQAALKDCEAPVGAFFLGAGRWQGLFRGGLACVSVGDRLPWCALLAWGRFRLVRVPARLGWGGQVQVAGCLRLVEGLDVVVGQGGCLGQRDLAPAPLRGLGDATAHFLGLVGFRYEEGVFVF